MPFNVRFILSLAFVPAVFYLCRRRFPRLPAYRMHRLSGWHTPWRFETLPPLCGRHPQLRLAIL